MQRKKKAWKEPRELTALPSSVTYVSGTVFCCLNCSCSCFENSIFLNLSARSHLIVNLKYKCCSVWSTHCFNFLSFVYWLLAVMLCTSTSSMYSIFSSNNRKKRFIKHWALIFPEYEACMKINKKGRQVIAVLQLHNIKQHFCLGLSVLVTFSHRRYERRYEELEKKMSVWHL